MALPCLHGVNMVLHANAQNGLRYTDSWQSLLTSVAIVSFRQLVSSSMWTKGPILHSMRALEPEIVQQQVLADGAIFCSRPCGMRVTMSNLGNAGRSASKTSCS